jgi:DNA-binding NarL/FixJ family response regulator
LRGKGVKQKRTHMHRLIAEAFIGPPPFRMACVRHLDGNPRNNSISNLSWGTYKENEDDKFRHGTHAKRISNGKLTSDTMKLARTMRNEGATTNDIAKEIGVSRPTISRFLNGRTWQ